MCKPETSYELMALSLRHIFTDTAVKNLFGSGPERALAIYQNLLADGTNPSIYLEFPLFGPASYDVFVGPYGDELRPGTHMPPSTPHAFHAAWEWASSLGKNPAFNLLFEFDAAKKEDRHAGIHFRHMGNIHAAEGFYRAIGDGWRAPLYRGVAEKLPKGWLPAFAAVFAGRPGAPTRLELFFRADERLHIARNPGYLGTCLEHVGFCAYNRQMLEDISAIVALDRPCSLQLDILADGTLGETLSVASFFEELKPDNHGLFTNNSIIAGTCGMYERMGVCDGRWRLAEQALFAGKTVMDVNNEKRWVSTVSIPICGKAKWIGAIPQPAKFYLAQRNVVGECWLLSDWITKPRP